MPRIIETTVYQFDELSDKAKEKARDWWREGVFTESHDWDSVYEDAETIATLMGIDIGRKHFKTIGGKDRSEPAIFFSGFSSQGDGACFEGSYTYKADAVAAVKGHAPKDDELHNIAQELTDAQALVDNSMTAKITTRGNYSHSGTMQFDIEASEDESVTQELFSQAESRIIAALRGFADWIYSQLEKEYEWQTAAEQIDESIRANEYEFTAEGKRA